MESVKGRVESHLKISSYKDLLVWQKAHKLAISIFEISRESKRTQQNFFIWSQILRSSFSVAANIVEGYYSHKGKNYVSRLEIARGEAGETEYWLFVLKEVAELDEKTYNSLSQECLEVILMLNSIIKKLG